MTATFVKLHKDLQTAIAAVDRTEINNIVWELCRKQDKLKAHVELLTSHLRFRNEQIEALTKELEAMHTQSPLGSFDD